MAMKRIEKESASKMMPAGMGIDRARARGGIWIRRHPLFPVLPVTFFILPCLGGHF